MASPSILFGATTSMLNFGMHRLIVAWGERSFPAVATRKRLILTVCAAVSVCPWLARYLTLSTRSPAADFLFAVSLAEALIVLSSAIPIAVLMVLSRRPRQLPEAASALPAPVL